MKKRILSLTLVLLMIVSILPAMPMVCISAADSTNTLFDRYIPVNQAYSAKTEPFGVTAGAAYTFGIGTRFYDETAKMSLSLAPVIKRKDIQGYYFKLSYKGTFGSLDKADMMKAFNLEENYYLLIMGDPSATRYENYKDWITKDTIIISVDLYDADKKFVRTVSPATAIMAAGPQGEFLTCSMVQGYTCSIYFSTQDNIYKGTDDKVSYSRYIHFTPSYAWLEEKSVADKLLNTTDGSSNGSGSDSSGTTGGNSNSGSSGSKTDGVNYKFKQHSSLKGTPQYMTNNILSVNEFIAPDNTYYQAGHKEGAYDPYVANMIKNVADYSQQAVTVSDAVTRRTVLTTDGTLYGIFSNYKKEKIATGVKQAGMYHYLTTKGEVKEIKSGKTIATNCKAFAEHRYGRVIGILKNDDTFSMGYTFRGEQRYYEKGLVYGKKENVKTIVPGGICTKDNYFYRWAEDVKIEDYTMDPATGSFSQTYTLNLRLEYITNNAARVFPYEYYTAENDDYKEQTGATEAAKTGFVENTKGQMWAFGLQDVVNMGTLSDKGQKSLIRRILPVYQSTRPKIFDNGNFVALLPEENNNPYMLINSHCTDYRPQISRCKVDYITDVPGGYRALDGYAYAFDNDPNDGTPIREFKRVPTSFHYLNDGSEIFKAINTTTGTGTVANLYLLPNVARSSYKMDNKNGNTILLERTDGSVWMTQIYPPASASTTVAKLGGWECSNAIQITPATKTKTKAVDYVNLMSQSQLESNFPAIKVPRKDETDAPKYMTSKYYSQVTPGKADQLSREGKKFLLLVTKTDCSYSKKMKSIIKKAIEKKKVPVYGCVNNYSSLEFVWNYTKSDSIDTPYFVLVNGDKSVTIKGGVRSKKAVDKVLTSAKKISVENDKITNTNAEDQCRYPSDKISVDRYEWGVLRYINRQRFAKKMTLYTMPDALQTACNTRENEIVAQYDHTRPNGERPYTTIPSSFSHKYVAENIAKGQRTSSQVVSEWMASTGHRANILNSKFTYLGVGYMNTNPPYWVQMFSDGAAYRSVTTSAGTMKFKTVKAMIKEYLICTDQNGVKSYMPLDTSVMSKKGKKYTLKLNGKKVTLTVTK